MKKVISLFLTLSLLIVAQAQIPDALTKAKSDATAKA